MSPTEPPIAIFLHNGSWDAVHQALSIAAAAVTMGRRVELYLFWWGLERIVRGELEVPDLERDDVNATLERRGSPTLKQLLEVVRGSGQATLLACTGSLAALGLNPPDVTPHVDELIGWTAILARTKTVTERFFL